MTDPNPDEGLPPVEFQLGDGPGLSIRMVPTVAVHHLPQFCPTHPYAVQLGGTYAAWFAQEAWAREFAAAKRAGLRRTAGDVTSAAEDLLRGQGP